MKISGNLIVFNEIDFIPQYLDNVLEIVDELIIIDGGSTDGTLDVIKSRDKRKIRLFVMPQEEKRYFGNWNEVGRRNMAIEKSSGEWILSLDVDELIDDEISTLLTKIVGDEKTVGYAFRRFHFWENLNQIRVNAPDDPVWYPYYHTRLFRRLPQIKYATKDPNGLHCRIHYGPVALSYSISPLRRMLKRSIYWAMGINVRPIEDLHIYEYHYALGRRFKPNDLRRGDLAIEKGTETDPAKSPNFYARKGIVVKPFIGKHPKAMRKLIDQEEV